MPGPEARTTGSATSLSGSCRDVSLFSENFRGGYLRGSLAPHAYLACLSDARRQDRSARRHGALGRIPRPRSGGDRQWLELWPPECPKRS